MPRASGTLEAQGINRFNRRNHELPVDYEFPMSVMNQVLPENGIPLEKTTLDFLEVGQAIASRGFVTGATGWQIEGDGDAEFNNVTIRGTIYATLGEIGGWSIDATRIYSATMEMDSDNEWIRSLDYVAGVSGFLISADLVEAENIRARGELSGVSFKYDVVSCIGGQLFVSASDTLAENMTAAD